MTTIREESQVPSTGSGVGLATRYRPPWLRMDFWATVAYASPASSSSTSTLTMT